VNLRRACAAAVAVAATASLAGLWTVSGQAEPARATVAKPSPPPAFRKAASQLDMVVLYPTDTKGLKLGFARKIVDPYCTKRDTESLRGIYSVRGSQTRIIELFEGRPRYCNGTSLWPLPGATEIRIHGRSAVVVDLCAVHDCFFAEGRWGVEWCERGTTVQLIAEGVARARLLEIARSMRPVDRAAASACAPRGS
jgi:hypothetical protein